MTKIMLVDCAPVDLTYHRLEQIAQDLPDLIRQYGKDSWLEVRNDYDSPYITIIYNREETDGEYNRRMSWDKQAKDRERIEYERLKAKFETGD